VGQRGAKVACKQRGDLGRGQGKQGQGWGQGKQGQGWGQGRLRGRDQGKERVIRGENNGKRRGAMVGRSVARGTEWLQAWGSRKEKGAFVAGEGREG